MLTTLTKHQASPYGRVMRGPQSDWTVCRAVIAMAALYALVLQTVLAGLVGVEQLDSAHVLCLQDADPSAPHPITPLPAHVHLSCCTAAHVAVPFDAPILAATAIVWHVRRAVIAAWPPEIAAQPRAPPDFSASARAPPVV